MRKQLLVALALSTFSCLGPRAAPAQLPGGIKIPKIPKREKAQPVPTPAASARPAPSEEATPAATNPAPPAAQAGGPTLIKTRVQFWPYTLTSYQGKHNDVWSWMPKVTFTTEGAALPSGAHYYVEVAQPGGAAWVKLRCVSTAHGGPTFECGGRDEMDESSTLATGVFTFAIKMRNPLEGGEKTLFNGRAKVEKVLTSGNIPPTSKQFVYYANQDWNLPIGHVLIGEHDKLNVRFWIRGGNGAVGLSAHLFYRGEEAGLYEKHGRQYGGGNCSIDMEYEPNREAGPAAPQKARWARVNCSFETIPAKPEADHPELHPLEANPGEYEVKVLRNRKLSRSIKFAVGPDGKIVDNRVAANNGMAWNDFIIVPVTILDDQDGTWDRNGWKTEAFYGNPLSGFNWPQQ